MHIINLLLSIAKSPQDFCSVETTILPIQELVIFRRLAQKLVREDTKEDLLKSKELMRTTEKLLSKKGEQAFSSILAKQVIDASHQTR